MPSFINISNSSASAFVLRKDVQTGDAYRVKGGSIVYGAFGTTSSPPSPDGADTRYLSVIGNGPTEGENASTTMGDKKCEIVGTCSVTFDIHEDHVDKFNL